MRLVLTVVLGLLTVSLIHADGLRDNVAVNVRPMPPAGIEVSAEDQSELSAGLVALAEHIRQMTSSPDDHVHELLPDVEIFHRAVQGALTHNEFFAPKDVKTAKELLRVGMERAKSLRAGVSPWTTQTGLEPIPKGVRNSKKTS